MSATGKTFLVVLATIIGAGAPLVVGRMSRIKTPQNIQSRIDGLATEKAALVGQTIMFTKKLTGHHDRLAIVTCAILLGVNVAAAVVAFRPPCADARDDWIDARWMAGIGIVATAACVGLAWRKPDKRALFVIAAGLCTIGCTTTAWYQRGECDDQSFDAAMTTFVGACATAGYAYMYMHKYSNIGDRAAMMAMDGLPCLPAMRRRMAKMSDADRVATVQDLMPDSYKTKVAGDAARIKNLEKAGDNASEQAAKNKETHNAAIANLTNQLRQASAEEQKQNGNGAEGGGQPSPVQPASGNPGGASEQPPGDSGDNETGEDGRVNKTNASQLAEAIEKQLKQAPPAVSVNNAVGSNNKNPVSKTRVALYEALQTLKSTKTQNAYDAVIAARKAHEDALAAIVGEFTARNPTRIPGSADSNSPTAELGRKIRAIRDKLKTEKISLSQANKEATTIKTTFVNSLVTDPKGVKAVNSQIVTLANGFSTNNVSKIKAARAPAAAASDAAANRQADLDAAITAQLNEPAESTIAGTGDPIQSKVSELKVAPDTAAAPATRKRQVAKPNPRK